jgi:hypothetical protein
LLANADIVIGPSSGPMHLASLCGAPHVTWTDKASTKRRYLGGWNPHKTPCIVLDQSKREFISPVEILKAVSCMLDVVPQKESRGVVYVCIGAEWPAILAQSLDTLRMHYAGAVSVLTDNAEAVAAIASKYAADVVKVDCPDGTPQTKSRWIKTQLCSLSPFDETLYIDCDTVVMGSLDNIWQCLQHGFDVAMKTETAFPTVGKRDYRNNPIEKSDTINLCGSEWPHYHSSTILFRKSPASELLFKVWHREWAYYGLTPKRPRIQDQPALARATYLTRVPIALLPDRYNARYDAQGGDVIKPDTAIYSMSVYRHEWHESYPALRDLAERRKQFAEAVDCLMPVPTTPRIRRMGDR